MLGQQWAMTLVSLLVLKWDPQSVLMLAQQWAMTFGSGWALDPPSAASRT
jgi:hypothetical protein